MGRKPLNEVSTDIYRFYTNESRKILFIYDVYVIFNAKLLQ